MTVMLLLCGCMTAAYYSGRNSGRADASRDLENSVVVLGTGGLLLRNEREFPRLLRERFGIEERRLAGCLMTDRSKGYEAGYHQIMDAEIERRFGTNIWERIEQAREDARKLYEEKLRKAQAEH